MIKNQFNKDVMVTIYNQVWRLLSGPLTLILIPLYLTEVEQGYWFLFGSMAALSILADLGFSNIILQFSAHEFAFLKFEANSTISGDPHHMLRLGSFLRFTLKWTFAVSAIAFPIIYGVGNWFLNQGNLFQNYFIPWTIYLCGSLLYFIVNSVLSYVEGMNKIRDVQKLRLMVAIANTIIIVATLMLGGKLFAIAIGSVVSSTISLIYLVIKFRPVLLQMLMVSRHSHVDWKQEVSPLFNKYALSFASGYFTFQIFTPLMQYFYGPIESGKVGITLALVSAVFSLSNIWIYTITPQINIFASKKDKARLDEIFDKRLFMSLATYLMLSGLIIIAFKFLNNFLFFSKILSRFLPLQTVFSLLVCFFFQLIVNSWAIYLRAHKQEPYVIPSIFGGIWIAAATYLSASFLPKEYFFFGLFSSFLWGVPVTYHIFKKCQGAWYAEQ